MAGSMACSHAFWRRRGSSATRQEYTRTRTRSGTAEHSLARPTISSRDYGASQLASRSLEIGNWKWNLEIGMAPIGHRIFFPFYPPRNNTSLIITQSPPIVCFICSTHACSHRNRAVMQEELLQLTLPLLGMGM